MHLTGARETERPLEQPCGQYIIHKKGHSLTITIPSSIFLEADEFIMREGIYQERTIYLKAVPLDAALDGDPGTHRVTTTEAGDPLTEAKIKGRTFSVRCKNRGKRLTIPADCRTDRFAKKTSPMIVSAWGPTGVAYLKFIPQCLYDRADSHATTDLVAAEQTRSTAPKTAIAEAMR
jgi:hypothetical protein